jgi:hypothetical protein
MFKAYFPSFFFNLEFTGRFKKQRMIGCGTEGAKETANGERN